jgi:hypothetical protein
VEPASQAAALVAAPTELQPERPGYYFTVVLCI